MSLKLSDYTKYGQHERRLSDCALFPKELYYIKSYLFNLHESPKVRTINTLTTLFVKCICSLYQESQKILSLSSLSSSKLNFGDKRFRKKYSIKIIRHNLLNKRI